MSDVIHNLFLQCPLLRNTELGRKGLMWDPFGAGSWSGLLKHTINLFERQALGLGDKKIGVDEAGSAEGAPNEKDAGA